MTRLFSLLMLLISSFMGTATALEGDSPFRIEVAPLTVSAGARVDIQLVLVIPDGFHVYRDMVQVRVDDPGIFQVGEAVFPPGVEAPDPAFPDQTRELYQDTIEILLPLTVPETVPAGGYSLDIWARYQGCKKSLCYLPQSGTYQAMIKVEPPPGAAQQPVAAGTSGSGPSMAAPPADSARPGSRPTVSMAIFGSKPPLNQQNPVAVRAVSSANNEVLVGFFMAEGWHVNKDMTTVELAETTGLSLKKQKWPASVAYTDAASGMTRREIGGDFMVRVRCAGDPGEYQITLNVRYQACKENLCLMPQEVALPVTMHLVDKKQLDHGTESEVAKNDGASREPALQQGPPATNAPEGPATRASTVMAKEPPAESVASSGGNTFESVRERGIFWLVLFVFGTGFLVSLTPCVLPMIPITMGIIGAQAAGGRWKALSLSATYVAGMAMVYTILGVTAGLTGSLFGSWMQSPWVVGGVSLFFTAMAFAMFGLFDVSVPSGLATRLNRFGGPGYVGAFVVGMIGAVVAGPCSGPVVVSLMVLIGQQSEVFLGIALMLAFSLGMGVLFLLAGVFSSTIIRPGAWMESVKKFFGVLMLLGAIYFISAHLPDVLVPLLVSAVLMVTAVFGWPADDSGGFYLTRTLKLYSIVAALVAAWLLLGTMAVNGFLIGPLSTHSSTDSHGISTTAGIHWLNDESEALVLARSEGKPMMVDFTADWCAACKELETFTYSNPAVVDLSRDFVALLIDATSDKDPQVKALLEKYKVKGLPTVAFVAPDGTLFDDITVTGFVDAEEFLSRMKKTQAKLGP